jgi:Transposase DDE domain group 1
VTTDGRNLITHAGAALLAELADRSGLTAHMSAAMEDCGISWHTHDPGVVLTHLAVAIADGADCLSDLDALRRQSALFGPVASVPTAWRALDATASVELRRIEAAVAAAREKVWAAAPPGGSIVIDFDATLLDAHSDKQDAAPTYKHGYGFHPLGTWCDTTCEPLAGMLRPGNAGSNTADDHLELLDRTIAVLPPEYRLGHEPGDDPTSVVHPILVRSDSAGATHGFVEGLVEANIGFSIGYPVDDNVRSGLFLAQEEDWVPAVEKDGTRRQGAFVTELTDLVDLSSWPDATRLICRREHPHPGAQLSLFDSSDGEWRHTCFITDREGNDVAVLELGHRRHARVEDRVRCWKDTGLKNLPFEGYVRNEAWLAVSLVAGALLSWSQMTCFTGELQKAEPKTLRYRVLHVAAVLVRRGRDMILRLDRDWPWTGDLAEAYARLRAALP